MDKKAAVLFLLSTLIVFLLASLVVICQRLSFYSPQLDSREKANMAYGEYNCSQIEHSLFQNSEFRVSNSDSANAQGFSVVTEARWVF